MCPSVGGACFRSGVSDDLAELEDAREQLTEAMLDALEPDPGAPLIVHLSDGTWWRAHPECARIPHEVQQVAAALAASLAEVRSPIVGVEPEK